MPFWTSNEGQRILGDFNNNFLGERIFYENNNSGWAYDVAEQNRDNITNILQEFPDISVSITTNGIYIGEPSNHAGGGPLIHGISRPTIIIKRRGRIEVRSIENNKLTNIGHDGPMNCDDAIKLYSGTTKNTNDTGLTEPIYPKTNIITSNNANQEKSIKKTQVTAEEEETISPPSINTILYGPPGTGKTYSTLIVALRALGILENQSNEDRFDQLTRNDLVMFEEEEHEELKDDFNESINSGRIVFTTFHQSYSYEDFIEGIRVETINGNPHYSVKNGVFKKLARKASFWKRFGRYRNKEGFNRLCEWYADTPDNDIRKNLQSGGNKHDPNQTPIDLIAQSITDGHDSTSDGEANFIIIIDEINRGNISKIFGELITLIEDSKRDGKSDCVPAILPYSGERFVVPDNLYIIGTMNTADRSLAALDIALRRRFDFIEMMPQPSFLRDLGIKGKNGNIIELDKWLEELNKRIEYLRGREFTIGHAFFASLKKNPDINILAGVMRNKILPLLDEYFFEDWEGIITILGDNDQTGKTVSPVFVKKIAAPNLYGQRTTGYIYNWEKASLTDELAYIKLYNPAATAGTAGT